MWIADVDPQNFGIRGMSTDSLTRELLLEEKLRYAYVLTLLYT